MLIFLTCKKQLWKGVEIVEFSQSALHLIATPACDTPTWPSVKHLTNQCSVSLHLCQCYWLTVSLRQPPCKILTFQDRRNAERQVCLQVTFAVEWPQTVTAVVNRAGEHAWGVSVRESELPWRMCSIEVGPWLRITNSPGNIPLNPWNKRGDELGFRVKLVFLRLVCSSVIC